MRYVETIAQTITNYSDRVSVLDGKPHKNGEYRGLANEFGNYFYTYESGDVVRGVSYTSCVNMVQEVTMVIQSDCFDSEIQLNTWVVAQLKASEDVQEVLASYTDKYRILREEAGNDYETEMMLVKVRFLWRYSDCYECFEVIQPIKTVNCSELVNAVVFAETLPVNFAGVYIPIEELNGRSVYQNKSLPCKTIRYDFDAGFDGFLWIAECEISGNILYSDFPNDAMYPWGFLWQDLDLTRQAMVSDVCCNGDGSPATWELTDTDGTQLQTGSIPSGGSAVIVAPDATVENSNQSYQDIVLSNGLLILPDITVTDSDGSTFTQSAVEDVTCSLAQPVDIDINGSTEGLVASGGTADIQLVDQDANPITPDSVNRVGDTFTVAITAKDLEDYTCQELKDDLTTSQKICVRDAMFFQKSTDGIISLQSFDPDGAIASTMPNPMSVYDTSTGRVFFIVQGNSSQVLGMDGSFARILRTTTTGTAWETDFKMAADGNIYISKHGTNGVQAFQWINPSTLAISGFDLGGRISGMIAIGDFLYITPGTGNSNGQKIIRYNVFTNAIFVTSSIDTNASLGNGNYNHMAYDGSNVICHIGTGASTVSFYSISGNATLATVNISDEYRWSAFYDGKWYVYNLRFENATRLKSKLTVIDGSTYSILRTLDVPLMNAPLRHGNKLISSGGFSGSTAVFDLPTERFYSLNYGGVPFIYDTNKLGILTANDMTNFPSVAQNCGLFLNVQDII